MLSHVGLRERLATVAERAGKLERRLMFSADAPPTGEALGEELLRDRRAQRAAALAR